MDIGGISGNLDGLQEPRFRLGGTEFSVKKLLPFDSFRVAEMIRSGVGSEMARVEFSGNAAEDFPKLLYVAFGAKEDAVERIRVTLFKTVKFKNGRDILDWIQVEGSEGIAFEDPVYVYGLLARCIAINFSKSLAVALSLIPREPEAEEEPIPETSPSSSLAP